jgi:hypothetical protein
MTVDAAVNFEEIARSTEDFNGAQLKAVCVEAVRGIGSFSARSYLLHPVALRFPVHVSLFFLFRRACWLCAVMRPP